MNKRIGYLIIVNNSTSEFLHKWKLETMLITTSLRYYRTVCVVLMSITNIIIYNAFRREYSISQYN